MAKYSFLIFLIVCSTGFGCAGPKSQENLPKRNVAWYWHTPFKLNKLQVENLKKAGISQLFVRAGTISSDGSLAELIMPQRWPVSPTMPTHLVYRIDNGVTRHFEDLDLGQMAKLIGRSYQIVRASQPKIKGLQLDFDCPTRLLPRYGELLEKVKLEMKSGELSITGLVSWLDFADLSRTLAPLDFWSPQFYEGNLPGQPEDDITLANLSDLSQGMEKLVKLGKPFYLGTPLYGHALIFAPDQSGPRTFRSVSLAQAFSHPQFKFLRSKDYPGEDHFWFQAKRQDTSYTVKYIVPKRTMTIPFETAALKAPNCLGLSIFRIGEPDEMMAFSPQELAPIVVESAKPLVVRRAEVSDPFDVIEGRGSSTKTRYDVEVQNPNPFRTSILPEGIQVLIKLEPGTLLQADGGDFEIKKENLSPARTIRLLARTSWIEPGGIRRLGPIFLTKTPVALEVLSPESNFTTRMKQEPK